MKLAAHRILPSLLGIFCLAAVPTCASNSPDVRADATTARIQKEVRHELLLLPYYSVFDNLTYQVEGTKVILNGEVWQPVVKPDAEAAVKSIEGVTQVVNNVHVLPPSNMDDELRHKLYFAIYRYPPLAKYSWQAIASIRIIVDSGHVTLEGVVDNQSDKEAAGIRANGVPGVFSVQNNLHVPSR